MTWARTPCFSGDTAATPSGCGADCDTMAMCTWVADEEACRPTYRAPGEVGIRGCVSWQYIDEFEWNDLVKQGPQVECAQRRHSPPAHVGPDGDRDLHSTACRSVGAAERNVSVAYAARQPLDALTTPSTRPHRYCSPRDGQCTKHSCTRPCRRARRQTA